MTEQPIVERALAALDEAFTEQMKERFATLCGNLASGETPDASLGMFTKAVCGLRDAHAHARGIAIKVLSS